MHILKQVNVVDQYQDYMLLVLLQLCNQQIEAVKTKVKLAVAHASCEAVCCTLELASVHRGRLSYLNGESYGISSCGISI